MFNAKAMLILLIGLLVLPSCAGKKGKKTATHFSLLSARALSGIASEGGVMVYGKNLSNGDGLALPIRSDSDANVQLSNGTWDFYAVIWEGSPSHAAGLKELTGTHLCGFVGNVELKGGDISIPFNLNSANCAGSILKGEQASNNFSSNQFSPLNFRSCGAIPGTFSAGSDCGGAAPGDGGTLSLKISLLGYEEKGGVFLPQGALTSRCIEVADMDSSDIVTPLGTSMVQMFAYRFHYYNQINCGGSEIKVNYRHGPLFPANPNDTAVFTSGNENYLLFSGQAPAPFIVLNPPVDINIANASAYNLSGICDSTGGNVDIHFNGNSVATTTCTGGSWSSGSLNIPLLGGAEPAQGNVAINIIYDSGPNASSNVTYDNIAPASPSGLGWVQASPYSGASVSAAWTPSADIASQQIDYYTDASCITAAGTSNTLGAIATNDSFSGSDGDYYYTVTAFDNVGNQTISTCSSGMTIDTTAPLAASALNWVEASPLDGVTATATWTVSGSSDINTQSVFVYTDSGCTISAGVYNGLGDGITTQSHTGSDNEDLYFKVKVYDHAGNSTSSSCSLTAMQLRQNDPPILDSIADQLGVSENSPISQINPGDGGDDLDSDFDPITYSCQYDSTADGTLAGGMNCTMITGLIFNSTTGVIDWTPDYSQAGTYELHISGSDGSLADDEIVVITVSNVNRVPDLDPVSGPISIPQDDPSIIWDAGDNGNDFDIDLEALTYSCYFEIGTPDNSVVQNLGTVCNGTNLPGISFNSSTGVLDWTPTSSQLGEYEFKIMASDSSGGIDFQYIHVRVLPIVFKDLAAGNNHTCGIDDRSRVFCWGDNSSGQIGAGTATSNYHIPTLVDDTALGSNYFVGIKSGANHVCGIADDAKIWCWGKNTNGEMGINNINANQKPTASVDESNLGTEYFVDIALGQAHTCGLTNVGNVFCWGNDSAGQLGNDISNASSYIPVAINTSVIGGDTIIKIGAGDYHTCAMGSSRKTYCWGNGQYGRLGDSYTTNRFTPVEVDSTNWNGTNEEMAQLSGGNEHTCAVTEPQNKTYCWGNNSDGRLGDGSQVAKSIPVLIDESNLGGNYFIEVASGWNHTCGQTDIGDVFCWGSNSYGQLGKGAGGDEVKPVAIISGTIGNEPIDHITVGQDHSCIVGQWGNIHCWGYDGSGQLGNGSGVTANQSSATLVDFNATP